jgi:hypothetical protein
MPLLFTVSPNITKDFGAGMDVDAVEVDSSDPNDDSPISFVIRRVGANNLEGYGPKKGPIKVSAGTNLESINNQSEVDIDVYSV